MTLLHACLAGGCCLVIVPVLGDMACVPIMAWHPGSCACASRWGMPQSLVVRRLFPGMCGPLMPVVVAACLWHSSGRALASLVRMVCAEQVPGWLRWVLGRCALGRYLCNTYILTEVQLLQKRQAKLCPKPPGCRQSAVVVLQSARAALLSVTLSLGVTRQCDRPGQLL